MKITAEYSAPLYSYLHLTSNILHTTLLSQTLNLCSSLDTRHQISHLHKMTGTMSILEMSSFNILNWMAASIAWTYPALFSKIVVLLIVCQDLTYLKPDLQQRDSGTSQAMWHKILTALDFTTRTAENPFSTVQYFTNTDYQRKQKFWIFVNYEQRWTKWPKLNSGSKVITWSITGSWFAFSATSVTCDILSFKPIHQLSTVRTC